MAKKRSANGVNLSAEIRKVLDSGLEKGAEIKAAIKKLHNADVTDALIGNVKSRWKKQKQGGRSQPARRGRKPKAASKAGMTSSGNGRGSAIGNHGLQAAVDFIRSVGGVEQAKQLITTIEAIKRL